MRQLLGDRGRRLRMVTSSLCPAPPPRPPCHPGPLPSTSPACQTRPPSLVTASYPRPRPGRAILCWISIRMVLTSLSWPLPLTLCSHSASLPLSCPLHCRLSITLSASLPRPSTDSGIMHTAVIINIVNICFEHLFAVLCWPLTLCLATHCSCLVRSPT